MLKIPKYKYYFALFDFIIVLLAFVFTMFVVTQKQNLLLEDLAPFYFDIIALFLVLFLIFMFIFQYNGLYKINIVLVRASHLTSAIQSIFYGIISIIVISFFIKSSSFLDSRLILLSFAASLLGLIYVLRVEILRRVYIKLKNKQFKRNAVIVGGGKAGKLLATKLMFEDSIGVEIVGFVDDYKKIDEEIVGGKNILGRIEDIPDLVDKYDIDEVLIVMDNVSYERLLEILDFSKQLEVNVRLTSELFDIVVKKVSTEKYADVPVIDVSPRINNKINLALKRVFDIVIASFGLIILSPLFLTIAVLIKVSSPGPIFFYQARIGRNGQAFQMYKFRSMNVANGEDEERKKKMIEFMNAEKFSGDAKVINDSRITKIGRIIRKTSLDEFPQLFNVIKGDMSLVGPRPCLPYEFENYAKWQKRRVNVLPGCTGVWQVAGRSSVSFKDSVVLDLYYINNMSPWLDIQILIKTIPVLLFSRGGK